MIKTIFALACALILTLTACDAPGVVASQEESKPSMDTVQVKPKRTLKKKALDDYTWEELSRISKKIEKAKSDEEGRTIAIKYGLVNEDGSLSSQTKQIVLNDTRALDVRLAGIRHDNKADGSGRAGLTFMTVGAIDIRPMNTEETVVGGWEASNLRAWLASEAIAMLDDDLLQALVEVNKLTNNTGFANAVDCVTNTSDKLWVFSVHEVCGDVHWDIEEYRQLRGYQDVDGMLNAEGTQYEVFAAAGVDGRGNSSEFLSLENSTGPSPVWYRTPHPFEFEGYGNTGSSGYFYRIMPSGFPESMGVPTDPSAVVVGFCV